MNERLVGAHPVRERAPSIVRDVFHMICLKSNRAQGALLQLNGNFNA